MGEATALARGPKGTAKARPANSFTPRTLPCAWQGATSNARVQVPRRRPDGRESPAKAGLFFSCLTAVAKHHLNATLEMWFCGCNVPTCPPAKGGGGTEPARTPDHGRAGQCGCSFFPPREARPCKVPWRVGVRRTAGYGQRRLRPGKPPIKPASAGFFFCDRATSTLGCMLPVQPSSRVACFAAPPCRTCRRSPGFAGPMGRGNGNFSGKLPGSWGSSGKRGRGDGWDGGA